MEYLKALAALAFVVSLIGVFGFLAKKYSWGKYLAGQVQGKRLQITEVLPLDPKRRLVLVKRDNTEHLILLGPDYATVVEAGISEARNLKPEI